MRKATARTVWILAFLAAGFAAGCGREQTANPAPPFVVSTVAANGATAVPVAQAVTATFNKLLNSATVNATTFTLTGRAWCP